MRRQQTKKKSAPIGGALFDNCYFAILCYSVFAFF